MSKLPANRTLDGTGNNQQNPLWGAVGSRLLRRSTVSYDDGTSAPSGPTRANARDVSNRLCKQTGSIPSKLRLTDFAWLWGQFVSHSLQSSGQADPVEDFSILVPSGDPVFPPGSHIPVARTEFDLSTGTDPGNPRQQLNDISSYLDASPIYGLDVNRAAAVRTFHNGKLRTSTGPDGDLLPLNACGLLNDQIGPDPHFFLAGDFRVNAGFGLMALQTLFLREHNRLAAELAAATPTATDEQIYQRARKLVGALTQVCTYEEFLPAMLGPHGLGKYHGYDPNVDAMVSNEFAAAGFRFGHSFLSPELLIVFGDGSVETIHHRDALLNIGVIHRNGIGPVLRGFASQIQQEADIRVIDDIRNIHPPGGPPLDLVAIDIQRARDQGIPDYNQLRRCFGLHPVASFADITSDRALQHALESVYKDVASIDPLIGGLAEDHTPGGALGPLFSAMMKEQFTRLRAGDRFWYENDPSLSSALRDELRETRLTDVIQRNTDVSDVSDDVFHLP
jgi:peroxidase